MTSDTAIKLVLFETMENLILPCDKAPENTEIDYTRQSPFVRYFDQPTVKDQFELGTDGFNLHKGVFHIEICFPGNAGVVAPANIADIILPIFKRGTDLEYNGVKIRCEKCRIVTAYVENSWYILPIHITYRAIMENA